MYPLCGTSCFLTAGAGGGGTARAYSITKRECGDRSDFKVMRLPLPPSPQASGLTSWGCFLPHPLTKSFVLCLWDSYTVTLCSSGERGTSPLGEVHETCACGSSCFSSPPGGVYVLCVRAGAGAGEEDESEQSQAQGPTQSSTNPGLPCGRGGQERRPTCSHLVPLLRSCPGSGWGGGCSWCF